MLDIALVHGDTLHVLHPLNREPLCGRGMGSHPVLVARDMPAVWAYRFIGSEDFGSHPDGSAKGAALHCVECVMALAGVIENA